MDNKKPKKIVTGLYFMTILGYVAVGLLAVFSGYMFVSYLFGAFNQPNISLEGLQFKESEVVISRTGGTAEITLLSPDGLLREQQSELEENKDAPKGVYNVSSVEITIQYDLMGKILKGDSPIKLPKMKDIHLGQPFTIQAIINEEDKGNIGGDCYLVAKVVSTDDKIYITKTPLHIFVDVEIQKITSITVKPCVQDETINDGEDEIEQSSPENSNYEIVSSKMYVGDNVQFKIDVFPARAINPHTAKMYTEKDSASYVADKQLDFEFSDTQIFVRNQGGQSITFTQTLTSQNPWIKVSVNPWYNASFGTPISRYIYFTDISLADLGDFVVDLDNNFVVDDDSVTLNVKLQVSDDYLPVMAFTVCDVNLPATSNDTDKQKFLSLYNQLEAGGKVINLGAQIEASGNRKSFNNRFPTTLQSYLSNLKLSYSSSFDGAKPKYYVEEGEDNDTLLNSAIELKAENLGQDSGNNYVWFLYVTREIESNETVNIFIDYAEELYDEGGVLYRAEGEPKDYSKSCIVTIKTTLVSPENTGWDKMFAQTLSDEMLYERGAMATTLSCEITKNGDLEDSFDADKSPYVINLKSNIVQPDATYTKLVYLVKQSEVLNSVNCSKIKVSNNLLTYNGEQYYMLYQENGVFKIETLGGGNVTIHPFLVKTNIYGEPVDAYYNVITQAIGAVEYKNYPADTDLTNMYVFMPTSAVNPTFQLDELDITISEKLSGFKFYDSLDFVEPITKFVTDGTENTFYAVGNSTLALSNVNTTGFSLASGTGSIPSTSASIEYQGLATDVGRTYLKIQINDGNLTKVNVKYADVSTLINIKSITPTDKTVVFKVGTNYSQNATGEFAVILNEKAMESNTVTEALNLYLENGYAVKPYYQAEDNVGGNPTQIFDLEGGNSGNNNTAYEYWRSGSINVGYLLILDHTTTTEGEGEGATIVSTPVTYKLDGGDYSFDECITEWLAGNSIDVLKGYLIPSSSGEGGFGILELDDETEGEEEPGEETPSEPESPSGDVSLVNDKILMKNGIVYKLDKKDILDKLNGKDNMFYRLFCVAYDMNGSSLGKIAFMEMKYSINTASAISKPISLTKYSVIDEDTEETTYYCKFNVDEIYKITIGNSIVATNYGLTGTNNEDFGTVLFPEGSENFENGSLVGDKYVLKMKNGDATGNLGTISLKCEARWGVKIGNVFVPIKIAQDSSVIGEIEEVYDNFEITINYVLYLGEIEPDDGPEPEPEPVVPGDGGDPDGGDDDPDDDYEEGLEPD